MLWIKLPGKNSLNSRFAGPAFSRAGLNSQAAAPKSPIKSNLNGSRALGPHLIDLNAVLQQEAKWFFDKTMPGHIQKKTAFTQAGRHANGAGGPIQKKLRRFDCLSNLKRHRFSAA